MAAELIRDGLDASPADTVGIAATLADGNGRPSTYAALIQEHRAEIARLSMELAAYRALLEHHGITPPSATGAEWLALYRECCLVVDAAHDFVASLGTSAELIWNKRWRP